MPQDTDTGLDMARTAEGLDPEASAEKIFSLLDFDTGDSPPEDDEEGIEDPAEEPEEDEDAPSEEDDDAEEVEDLDDEEEEDEDDPDGTDDPEAPQTYKVQVDGEELEVTLEEALAGYQRQQAFTKKTQEVAEERKAVKQEVETLREKQLEYGQALEQAEQFLTAVAPEEMTWSEEKWADLKQRNPREFADRLTKAQEYQAKFAAVKQEQQRLMAEVQAKQDEATKDRIKEERELLTARIPGWVDDDTRAEEQDALVQYAQNEYEWTPAEISGVTDHRLMTILWKAMKFDQMQESAPKIRQKRKKDGAPTLKPGSRSSKRVDPSKKATKAAKNRLRGSGKVDDAADAILGLLDE